MYISKIDLEKTEKVLDNLTSRIYKAIGNRNTGETQHLLDLHEEISKRLNESVNENDFEKVEAPNKFVKSWNGSFYRNMDY